MSFEPHHGWEIPLPLCHNRSSTLTVKNSYILPSLEFAMLQLDHFDVHFWEMSGSIFFIPSQWVAEDINWSSSFRLNKPTFFCVSLFVTCSSSLFVWWPFTRLIAICWYLSCLILPQTVHSSAQAASQVPEGDGVITSLDLLARLTDISQRITSFHCYKNNCSLKPALVVHWNLFCKAAVYPVSSWLLGLLYPRCRTYMFALIGLEEINTSPGPQPFRVLLITALALRESAASLNLMSSTWVTCWYLFALASNMHCYWHVEVRHWLVMEPPVAAEINSSKSIKNHKS